MPTTASLIASVLQAVLPLLFLAAGALVVLRKSGMLPAQQRLDEILQVTIAGLQGRVGVLEAELKDHREALQRSRDAMEAMERAHKKAMQDMQKQHSDAMAAKDLALAALQRALREEQTRSDELRARVADQETKLSALIALQRSQP